jgi:hypothetical protein
VATIRRHVCIDCPADTAWAVVGDPGSVTRWFPRMEQVEVDGDRRRITLASGIVLDEELVTIRDDLRRLQYRLLGPFPVNHHLATVDVLEDGPDRCVVVYATDVVPHALAFILDGAVGDALDTLVDLLAPAAASTEEIA